MDYLTIFLILLSFVVLYKIFYARLFPIILDKLTHGHPKKFVEIKQKLFEGLKGKVLEIGPGTGCNFKIIAKENIESWTGIEPNPFMNVYIENSIKEYNIQFPTKIINEKAEDMKQIESNSMDFVILSHVFCSVESGGVEKVLDEILRVLKPGGKVIFLEHILDRNLTVKKILQIIVSPLWQAFGYGCKFISFQNYLEKYKSKFTKLEYEFLDCKLGIDLVSPHLSGYGIK